MERYALTDEQWARIAHLLPEERSARRGRPFRPHRVIVQGILWVLCSGAKWRDLHPEFGPWKTVFNRFARWQREGLWDRIWADLLQQLDNAQLLSWELWCVDGSVVRAHRCAGGATTADPAEPADHALGRSKGGFGTKLHLLVDGQGIPLGLSATPGQTHEAPEFEHLMTQVVILGPNWPDELATVTAAEVEPTPVCPGKKNVRHPEALAGDKGYSSKAIREWIRTRQIEPVIPTRSNETRDPNFDKSKYRKRAIIECSIGWLKECRRVATRYEKKATHFLAMVKIAIIRRILGLDLWDRA